MRRDTLHQKLILGTWNLASDVNWSGCLWMVDMVCHFKMRRIFGSIKRNVLFKERAISRWLAVDLDIIDRALVSSGGYSCELLTPSLDQGRDKSAIKIWIPCWRFTPPPWPFILQINESSIFSQYIVFRSYKEQRMSGKKEVCSNHQEI